MAHERTSDAWIPACDLCGSLRYELVARTGGTTVRRCRDCGLVSVAHEEPARRREQGESGAQRLPEELQCGAFLGRDGDVRAALVIGTASERVTAAAREAGTALTVLPLPGHHPTAGARGPSLESAGYPPDSFDLIIVPQGLDSFASPSLLFDRARLWLVPGGRLLAGALNYQSLPARLRPRSWVRRYAGNAEHLFTPSVLRDYARRFGFNIASVRSRSHTRDVAAALIGSTSGRNEQPAWIAEMALAPVALASLALGMGLFVIMEMRKASLVTRPLLRTAAEEAVETAGGLAPALYTGVHMREE